ncbi:MAG TPA: TAT-variant-translocated molybdopterin oxidoreductase [Thermoanaerobaculia bacterium]|nr:TAT-variant-translocated molybdopterin oxidoreductase [Thermoanaerobaculia bacterium]
MSESKALDFKEFRKRVGDLRGREYWRSLEELSRDESSFDEFFHEEFPQQAVALDKGVDRRDFMKLMGASVAMAGLAACQQPAQSIVPYVRQPENYVPGTPLFFATAMTLGGFATGVLAESHTGRPTKIEGNPDHPSSLGGTDAFMQASVLNLYDPDRSQVVRHMGDVSTWSDFIAALQPVLKNPGGLRLLTQTITSPSLGDQITKLLAALPGMKWHQWEPVNGDNVREGARLAFGSYVHPVYHFDKANVVVSLGSDFMGTGPGHLRYARDFMSRRRVRKGVTSMNRLYAFESMPTSTGTSADHRWPVRPSQMESIARSLLAGNGESHIAAIVRDLKANPGASIVIAGDEQPPVVHAIAHAINQALGNHGTTITVMQSPEVQPVNQLESLRELVTDINAGKVQALVMLGGNPVFDAPADFKFVDAFQKVPFRAHLSHYYDETSELVHWHIPETHYLEAWGDGRAHDGSVSLQQPLIAPLYNGRHASEVLGAMLGGLDQSPYDVVKAYWFSKGFNDQTFRKALHDGVIANSAMPAAGGAAAAPTIQQPNNPTTGLELEIKPDPTIYDGRFANNGWLQELPKPQTKITWDNVLIVSPKTAADQKIGPDPALVNERTTVLAEVTYRGRKMRLPVWVMPGQPDNVLTIFFGYGRKRGGKVANDTGFNTYVLRDSDALHHGSGVQVSPVDDTYRIACTQEHQSINPQDEGNQGERGIIRSATFAAYQKDPNFAKREEEREDISMWPAYDYSKGNAWGMVIDTTVCTGCNGCVIACQSENNISIVGKAEVLREREMHWLRIDRYFRGPAENPEVFNQPVPCMQCENAPCEPVCPVGATSHSSEGLNDMTYNRCVGTRYCSNNCPYKVRRFNFFHYADYDTPALKPMRNPDVTIRTRGVMEKCTYCVQRVNAARIRAEKENRLVRDGEVTTACAQACPTEAIVFGNINDEKSRVRQLKEEPTNYGLLEELNTRPRTTYLAAIKNPNPEIRG